MELREFIKSTIIEISEGINEAQKELKDSGVIVNPSGLATNSHGKNI